MSRVHTLHFRELLRGTEATLILDACLYSAHMRKLRLGNNLSGQYKRSVGMAIQIGIGNLSSIIVSNVYLQKDAPRYVVGRTSLYIIRL